MKFCVWTLPKGSPSGHAPNKDASCEMGTDTGNAAVLSKIRVPLKGKRAGASLVGGLITEAGNAVRLKAVLPALVCPGIEPRAALSWET